MAHGLLPHGQQHYGKPDTPRVSPRREREGRPYKQPKKNVRPIVALIERGGSVRTFHVPVADQKAVKKIVRENIAKESRLHTDESRLYFNASTMFAARNRASHVRGIRSVRGRPRNPHQLSGRLLLDFQARHAWHLHCKEKHLHRYLAEYDFRYNHRVKLGFNDGERAVLAVKGAIGKRLTYRQPH